jgi:hypothetical protein
MAAPARDRRPELAAAGCARCRHFARPGLADGYCAGRTDLRHVYGFLHELPADRGASCDTFEERT